MKEEILKLKGEIATTKSRIKELNLRASGLIALIRNILNPWEQDLSNINAEEALVHTKDLKSCIEELRILKARLKEMEDSLE